MSAYDTSIFKQPLPDIIKKIILACLAAIMIGIGIGLNTGANFGNDPISVFFDGLSKLLGTDIGTASNIANYTLFVVVLIFGRRYINIGTFIYTLPLGNFINMGVSIYEFLKIDNNVVLRILCVVLACILLFFGIGIFIAIDIGVDPWTGCALILKDNTNKQYKVFRVGIDMSALIVGFLLGGKVGVTTIATAILGGPIIQFMSEFINNYIFRLFKIKIKIDK